MLTWTAFACLALAGGVAGRWLLSHRDRLGRARPFPLVTVVVLAAVGAGLFVPVVRHHRLESRLGAVATELVGAPATVHCQTTGQQLLDVGAELGFVRYGADGVPEHATLIKRAQCGYLASYLHGDHARPSRDEIIAVHVLSHEARHMAGTTNEAVAECEAMQRDARTAALLGASPEEATALAGAYWREIYPGMPDDYRTAECVPDGPRDEHLPDAPWAQT